MIIASISLLNNRLHASQDDIQLAMVVDAFPVAESGTPLFTALAEVKSVINAQLLKADGGRGYKANMQSSMVLRRADQDLQEQGVSRRTANCGD